MKNYKILLIDDAEIIRMIISSYLRENGHKTDEAADGRSGLEALEKTAYDAVIVDMTLPDMSGEALILSALEKYPAVKFIIHTGMFNYKVPQTLISAGFSPEAVLLKPVSDLENIISLIKKLKGNTA
jgi:CheY-like chemotaxis protein